jgi:DNA invertase Pin-like site-specific DNA recombinase
MPRAIIYARVSTDDQGLDGDGIGRQLRGGRSWIAAHPEHDLTIVREAVDTGHSAYTGDHVAPDAPLGIILREAAEGRLAGWWLICESQDRLSRREEWEASHQLSGLVLANVTVVTFADNKVFSREKRNIGDMIGGLVGMSEANKSSTDKAGRVREGKERKVKDAQINKHVLYQNCPAWLVVDDAVTKTNRATRKPRVVPGAKKTIETIYDLGLHHGAGYITAWLTTNGVSAFGKSGRWNTHYVRRILRSKAVLGHLETKHGFVEDILPVMIEEKLWLRVQAAQKKRQEESDGGPRNGGFVNLYRGIGRCAECNGMMRTNTYPGKTYRYLECLNHVRKYQRCGNKSRYRVDILDAAVMAELGVFDVPRQGMSDPHLEDPVELSAQLETLRDKVKRLAFRIGRSENEDIADVLVPELRELRSEMAGVGIRLSVARKAAAVAGAPRVLLCNLTDRTKIHAALKDQKVSVRFGADNEVLFSAPGLAMRVVVRRKKESSRMLFAISKQLVAEHHRAGISPVVAMPEGFPMGDQPVGPATLKFLRGPPVEVTTKYKYSSRFPGWELNSNIPDC